MARRFLGYPGAGRPGIRNHVVVISVMDNVNGVARAICGLVRNAVPVTHPYGRAQLGQDRARHLDILAGLASNPNVAAAVIVSLERTHAEEVLHRMRVAKPITTVVVNEHRSVLEATLAGGAQAAEHLAGVSERNSCASLSSP